MKYTIQVWLFTVLFSPLFLFVILGFFINSVKFSEILASWPIIGFMILYGLVLSIPTMILFWFLQKKLMKVFTIDNTKLILSAYSFSSVWITFYVFDKGFVERGFQQIFWVIIYSLTIVLGVWFFKISVPPTNKNEQKHNSI